MRYVNTRWVNMIGGGTTERNPILDKAVLKRLAFDMASHTSVRANDMKPTLIISYDDSAQEDYTLAFPIHQSHNVPAEVNAISGFMLGQSGYLPDDGTKLPLTQEQALEMQAAGWEFTTHGRNHLMLGRQNLSAPSFIGGNKVYIPSDVAHRWTHTFPYSILISTHIHIQNPLSETNTVVSYGTDETGTYLLLSNPLQNNGYAFIRLSDEQIEDEIKGSIDDLTDMGLYVKHHSAAYNSSNWAARRIIRKYCLSSRRGDPRAVMIPNSENVFPTYKLGCFVEYTSKNESFLDAWLDDISSQNGLAIMMEHTWRPGFSTSGLDYIITGAKATGIDITTRTEALKRFGNLLELGDPFAGEVTFENDQPYFVVDRNGNVFENISDLSDLLKMPY